MLPVSVCIEELFWIRGYDEVYQRLTMSLINYSHDKHMYLVSALFHHSNKKTLIRCKR